LPFSPSHDATGVIFLT